MEIEIAPIMFAYATFFSLVEIAGVFCLVRLLMMLLDKKRKVSLLSGAVLLLLMFIFLVFLVWGIYQQWRALGEDVGWTLFFGIIPWGVGILIGKLPFQICKQHPVLQSLVFHFADLLLRLRGNLLQIFFLSGLMLQSLLKLPDFQLKRSSFFLCLYISDLFLRRRSKYCPVHRNNHDSS